MSSKLNGKTQISIRILLVSGLIVLAMLFVIFGISCQTPEVTPTPPPTPAPTPAPAPEPTPEPTPELTPPPPPTTGWSADGIITPEEYTEVATYGNYEIHWAGDEDYIYIGMKAKTNGFVAMAAQPGSKMKGADMIFGFVKDGEANVYDLFATDNFGTHPPDTELGGTNDILEFGGSEEGGFTTIEFKRALDTGDEYDNPLSEGANKIIWSYGSDDGLTTKHTNRGYGEINL